MMNKFITKLVAMIKTMNLDREIRLPDFLGSFDLSNKVTGIIRMARKCQPVRWSPQR